MTSAFEENHKYNGAMMAIHWLMALGIMTAFGAGLYMVDIPGITPDKLRLYNWHKWLGVTLFVLVAVRLGVRISSKTPRYPQHWGHRTIRSAGLGHVVLYLLMFMVPVFGYLFSLASGYPVVWFGLIKLPVILDKNPELKELFKTLHEVSAKMLVLLVLGHVGMALKHHFKDRDSILGRMIPGVRSH